MIDYECANWLSMRRVYSQYEAACFNLSRILRLHCLIGLLLGPKGTLHISMYCYRQCSEAVLANISYQLPSGHFFHPVSQTSRSLISSIILLFAITGNSSLNGTKLVLRQRTEHDKKESKIMLGNTGSEPCKAVYAQRGINTS